MLRARVTAFLFLIMSSIGCAHAQDATLQADIERLEKIKTYSIGLVGFSAHTSDGEMILRKILKSKNSEKILISILQSQPSTVEAKMYAACGLRNVSRASFSNLIKGFKEGGQLASVLRADILSKEKVSDLLNVMEKSGCKFLTESKL